MPNRLAHATSPYLRSHAENPVDWFEWGPEPFARARERDVPVLVSIGYSTCHWCHVMARESFSDPELAAYLNANFVAIKVDREEYPDVDASYLAAASAFTEQLGWPLNVFVTPAGGPFYGGTYWPPVALLGQPAFRDVLAAVFDAWTDRRDEVLANATGITTALAGYARPAGGAIPESFEPLVERLAGLEDPQYGGFGTAPKFPVATVLGFLLDLGERELATRTLAAMASSDLRDRVEGGFFRYATKRDWTEPHYERMLYDNALLLDCYTRVGDTATADGIAGFLTTVMRLPGGAFASAQDSESNVDGVRVEGTYYELSPEQRRGQSPPQLDAKVLAGWNGLAIEALARAGNPRGLRHARRWPPRARARKRGGEVRRGGPAARRRLPPRLRGAWRPRTAARLPRACARDRPERRRLPEWHQCAGLRGVPAVAADRRAAIPCRCRGGDGIDCTARRGTPDVVRRRTRCDGRAAQRTGPARRGFE
jgi:uncharacterized protein YyaL (SSP411 family)